MSISAAEYYQQWYKENKDAWNAMRRNKYKNSAEYRMKVSEWNRKHRQQRQKEHVEEQKKRVEERIIKPHRPRKFVVTMEDHSGKKASITLFTIGMLVKVLGRSAMTIRKWEDTGVIPATPIRTSRGDRFYTAEFIELIVQLLQKKEKIGYETGPQKMVPVLKKVRFKDGVRELKLFRISALARAIGRSIVALEYMEKRGLIPETPFKVSSLNKRLYSYEMIEVVRKALIDCGDRIKEDNAMHFKYLVEKGWRELGIFEACFEREEDDDEKDGRKKRSGINGVTSMEEGWGSGR
jgi:DNA-binding transcriptional MerR regulator